MTQDGIIDLGQTAIRMTMMVSAPMMLAAMVLGLVISLFQALTQINEQTLVIVPKIAIVFIILLIAAPWILQTMVQYTQELIISIPEQVRESSD